MKEKHNFKHFYVYTHMRAQGLKKKTANERIASKCLGLIILIYVNGGCQSSIIHLSNVDLFFCAKLG